MNSSKKTGFIGKMPSHGDFVYRNIPKKLEQELLNWAQLGIEFSKTRFEDNFLQYFLVAPLWRFYFSETLFGEAYLGVWIPSVDKVGRYFPFMVLTPVYSSLDPFDISCEKWFELAENLALSVLDPEFDFEGFLEQVQALKAPLGVWDTKKNVNMPTSKHPDAAVSLEEQSLEAAFHLTEITEETSPTSFQSILNQVLLRKVGKAHVQFWTNGGDKKKPSMLVDTKLLTMQGFSHLIV